MRGWFGGGLLAALLLVAPSLDAQQIAGRITEGQSGEPIAAVQVFIQGSGIGALSQGNGRYLLLNVPPGTHLVTAERIGYGSVSATVTVTAGQTAVQDFTMSESALDLDEIVVTGRLGAAGSRGGAHHDRGVAAAGRCGPNRSARLEQHQRRQPPARLCRRGADLLGGGEHQHLQRELAV
jgi:hypothetical protein